MLTRASERPSCRGGGSEEAWGVAAHRQQTPVSGWLFLAGSHAHGLHVAGDRRGPQLPLSGSVHWLWAHSASATCLLHDLGWVTSPLSVLVSFPGAQH